MERRDIPFVRELDQAPSGTSWNRYDARIPIAVGIATSHHKGERQAYVARAAQ
jgi:hypothetical protein